MNKSYLTINTDASYCQHTKAAGYAYWIKSENLSIQTSGVLLGNLDNPTASETQCILQSINAALFSLKNNRLNNFVLTIKTDSLSSIKSIQNPEMEIYILIRNKIDEMRIYGMSRFYLVHVRSHTGNSVANSWCDEQSREQMRKERIRRANKLKKSLTKKL